MFCFHYDKHLYIARSAAALYIAGDILLTEGGFTNRDPRAVSMSALATLPLIEQSPVLMIVDP